MRSDIGLVRTNRRQIAGRRVPIPWWTYWRGWGLKQYRMRWFWINFGLILDYFVDEPEVIGWHVEKIWSCVWNKCRTGSIYDCISHAGTFPVSKSAEYSLFIHHFCLFRSHLSLCHFPLSFCSNNSCFWFVWISDIFTRYAPTLIYGLCINKKYSP